jgi:DNA-binding MarR family transcriptional regulator
VRDVSQKQIRALAEFRHQTRRFLHFSEEAAKSAGVEPQQHQLMLAIKAVEPEPAGIGFLAERLFLRHHSVVGLVDRLEQAGLAKRVRSAADRRSAQVVLTPKGAKILHALARHHRQELKSTIPGLIEALTEILHDTILHDTTLHEKGSTE